jgi:hypothetical protein
VNNKSGDGMKEVFFRQQNQERTSGSNTSKIKNAFKKFAPLVCGIALAGYIVVQAYRIHDLPKAPQINGIVPRVTYRSDICTTDCSYSTLMNIRSAFEADYSDETRYLKVFYDLNHKPVMVGIGDSWTRYFMRIVDGITRVEETKNVGGGWLRTNFFEGRDADKKWEEVLLKYQFQYEKPIFLYLPSQ